MKEIEERLRDLNNNIEVPEDLEVRLRNALDGKAKRRKLPRIGLVAGLVVMIIVATNYTTLAQYIGQLFGFEEILMRNEFQSLRELAEEEKIQIVNQGNHFEDGMEIVVDGIVVDSDRVIIYYTLMDEKGDVDRYMGLIHPSIDQFRMSRGSTTWDINDANTEAKMISILNAKESTEFLGENIQVRFTLYEEGFSNEKLAVIENVQIEFNINEDLIINGLKSIYLDKIIELSDLTVYIENVATSATGTTLKGRILNKDNIDLGENDFIEVLMSLEADGKLIAFRNGSRASSKGNWDITTEFDAIPQNADKITLEIEGYGIHQYPRELLVVDKDSNDSTYRVGNMEFVVEDIKSGNGKTFITIDSNHMGMVLPKIIGDESEYRPLDIEQREEYITDNGQDRTSTTYVYDYKYDEKQELKLEFYDIVRYEYLEQQLEIPLKE